MTQNGGDIAAWLEALGLGQYADAFAENDVDLELLPELTTDDLREIGIASVGHRRRILTAAKEPASAAPPQTPARDRGGSAPDPEPGTGERRVLTIMFCDLVESTALSALADPEDFRDLIAHFRAEVQTAILDFGGVVSQFLGDGIMASFGYPVSSGHDAERAVAAGLDAVSRVARIPPFEGHQPEVRIGIATGLSVVGAVDPGLTLRDDSAIGETANLAARLQAVARPGTVAISDETRSLVGDIYDCDSLGAQSLKGIETPTQVWQVKGRSSTASRYDALRRARRGRAFVGRDAELAALRDSVARQRAGDAAPVLIAGETGIGKSRLTRQVLAAMDVDEPAVLQSSPYSPGVAFYPVRYLVAQAAGLSASDEPARSRLRLKAWLAAQDQTEDIPDALPLLLNQLEIGDGGDGLDPAIGAVELRARTIDLFHRLLIGLARDAGALVVEDVHWIDPSTVELLRAVLPDLRARGLPVLATTQPGPEAHWQDDLGVEVLPLERLKSSAVRQLVRGIVPLGRLDDAATEELVQLSDGVPLFAEELALGAVRLADSASSKGGRDDGTRVPLSLSESLMARLDRLEHGRKIVSVAAAIGREYPISILTAVSKLPESVVQAGIAELLSTGIIAPGQSRFGEAIRFRHNLLREAAYELLLKRQRIVLHAQIADTLGKDFPEIADQLPHVPAFHREAAGQFAQAEEMWEKAGQLASARSAYAEAAGYFERAVSVHLRVPASPERDDREIALRLSLVAALISARGHGGKGVFEQTERIMDLSRTLGNPLRSVQAMHFQWVRLLTSNRAQASCDFAHEVLEMTGDGPTVNRLIALRMCATSNLFVGAFEAALARYLEFMELFDEAEHADHMRTGHSDHTAIVMMGLSEVYTLMDAREEAEIWRQRSLDYARASSRVHDRCHTLTFSGCLHPYLMGQDDVVEKHAHELGGLMHHESLPAWEGFPELFLGLVQVRRGEVEEGMARVRIGARKLDAQAVYHNFWPLVTAEICVGLGATDEARHYCAKAARMMANGDVRFEAERLRVEARLLMAEGKTGRARDALRMAAEVAERQGAGLFRAMIADDLVTLGPGIISAEGAA